MATSGLLAAADAILTDFTKATPQWRAEHHVKNVSRSPMGLSFTVTDEDPWLISPPLQLPVVPAAAKRVVFSFTCATTSCADAWQLFYAFESKAFNETDSVRLTPVGRAPYTRFTAEVSVSALGSGLCRFRLDPPGRTLPFTVKTLEMNFVAPLWTYQPTPPHSLVLPADALILSGTDWELRHDPRRFGAFQFHSREKIVENLADDPILHLDGSGIVRTLDCSSTTLTSQRLPQGLETRVQLKDADSRIWRLQRTFTSTDAGLVVKTEISVNSEARVLHLPALTLFVDRASNGHKHQAMLAGVEYLGDEPSSNKKEIRTHEHNRLIPAEYRLSAPLAIFTDESNWLSANWESSLFATVFDTPDRLFKSGGHLLGFWAPTVGPCRRESELDVYQPLNFRKTTHTVTLQTGTGGTVADALEAVITPDKLPPPDAIDTVSSLELLARGWLDSVIRKGTQVRHAIGGNFGFNPIGDAPLLMNYLAATLAEQPKADTKLIARLRATAADMLAVLPQQRILHASVSHIHHPAPALVTGDVKAFLSHKSASLKNLNRQLATGKRIWKPEPGRPDFGETLGADHCNGFTSMSLQSLLGAAVWSGDEAEIAKALAILDKVTDLYHGTVPCGAQPWEMPLHTPDIVASANLTRAYTLGYLLKPDPKYLREARHWAYTGLSMVYLVPPPGEFDSTPVGRYATCAVMGATHWVAPNWIGRPVQWCGLVYSAALWDLARTETDPTAAAFWRKIATGITTSGIRQTHTAEDPELIGCLPDSWNLEQQTRYPVPINPGTVQENFAECMDRPYYALRTLGNGTLIHVPGAATPLPPQNGTLRCRIAGWPETPFKVVLTRLDKPARVTFNRLSVPYEYESAHRAAIITLPARATGEFSVTHVP